MSCASRLRRDEPPNPTPAAVRRRQRGAALMQACSQGEPADQLARRFGFADETAVRRGVDRARDRVFPFDLACSISTELRTIEAMSAALFDSVYPGAPDPRLLAAIGLINQGIELQLKLRAALGEVDRAERDPHWAEMVVADLGIWTAALQMRADGAAFRDIASALNLDQAFDANELVARDLLHFEQGVAVRLRLAQVAALDQRLDAEWPNATRRPIADLAAAHRALSILGRRARIRGAHLRFRGPLIDHPPYVRR